MKNEYEIRGEVTAIKIMCKGEILETLINTSDLEKVASYPYKWFGNWAASTNSFYVYANTGYSEKGKRSKMALHRWILGLSNEMVIDHIDHNSLNNCRENMRVVTRAENSHNLSGLKANNTSGFRGVHKNGNKWRATVRVNGKAIHLGYFDNQHDAGIAASNARKVYLSHTCEVVI